MEGRFGTSGAVPKVIPPPPAPPAPPEPVRATEHGSSFRPFSLDAEEKTPQQLEREALCQKVLAFQMVFLGFFGCFAIQGDEN